MKNAVVQLQPVCTSHPSLRSAVTLADARLGAGPPPANVPLIHSADGAALWADAAAAQRSPLTLRRPPPSTPPQLGARGRAPFTAPSAAACAQAALNASGVPSTPTAFAHLPGIGSTRHTVLDARDLQEVVSIQKIGPGSRSGGVTGLSGDWLAAQGFRPYVAAVVRNTVLTPVSVYTSAARALQDAQTLAGQYERFGTLVRDAGGRLTPAGLDYGGVGPRPDAFFRP